MPLMINEVEPHFKFVCFVSLTIGKSSLWNADSNNFAPFLSKQSVIFLLIFVGVPYIELAWKLVRVFP